MAGSKIWLLLLPLLSFVNALTWRGADFSSMIILENSGRVYHDPSSTSNAKLETILHNRGANIARIRIWTSTNSSQYSTSHGLQLAKRAAAAGMAIYVDLHYSDTWADPGHQSIPSAWPKDLAGLNTQIYTYTRDIVTQFASQGTPITFLEIGNEINDGMLWPVGRISVNGYDGLSQLLHSAAQGARVASSSVKVMIHLANGWDNSGVQGFFNNIFRSGQLTTSDVDVLGFSFYPFYDTRATFANLRTSLQNIVNKLNKDVMVVETDWPASGSCNGVTLSERSIAISASGQDTWVKGIRDVLTGISGGRGTGIVYWEPAWIGNAGLGSSCADALLVDGSGNTRSSISIFNSAM